jgi:hypothetical protein
LNEPVRLVSGIMGLVFCGLWCLGSFGFFSLGPLFVVGGWRLGFFSFSGFLQPFFLGVVWALLESLILAQDERWRRA